MKRKQVLLISAVAALCALAALAGHATGVGTKRLGVAFTLHSKVTEFLPDGTQVVSDVTRYESGDGGWREVQTRDGHTREMFFEQGRGFFSVNHEGRLLLRSDGTSKIRDNVVRSVNDELLKSPQLARTEPLLGHTAYVMQVRDGDILMGEFYVVPEFGRAPVKFISYGAAGRVEMVREPVSITPGEPTAPELKGPDYPEAPTNERLR